MTLERRTPMGRGKPLDRGAPLQRGVPLQRGKPLQGGGALPRSTPMPRTPPKLRDPGVTPKPRRRPVTPRCPVEEASRPVVRERSSGVCELGGMSRAAEMHHIRNRSQGGTWEVDNLLHLCSACHGWVTAHPRLARAVGGWARRRSEGPERQVLVVHRGWVWLDADGGVRPAPPPENWVAPNSLSCGMVFISATRRTT